VSLGVLEVAIVVLIKGVIVEIIFVKHGCHFLSSFVMLL
jgi:hypothetical protein